MTTFNTNFYIFCALLKRDFKILRRELLNFLINGVILIVFEALLYGYLIPRMGLPLHLISPLYLGSVILTLVLFGFTRSLNCALDLAEHRFIEYKITLPIEKKWLFAEYIVYFVIETLVRSVPVFIIGVLLLGSQFVIHKTTWILFILLYITALIFIALFFLWIAFCTSFAWFNDNIWPRILSPLISFGSLFYIWKGAYGVSPFIASLLLLNPLTYIAEGFRSSLIGSDQFISAPLCFLVLLISIALTCFAFTKSIYSRLDPV